MCILLKVQPGFFVLLPLVKSERGRLKEKLLNRMKPELDIWEILSLPD